MSPRHTEWRAPAAVLERFAALLKELTDLDPESERAYTLRDEIRGLPGYPHYAAEDDPIHLVETTIR